MTSPAKAPLKLVDEVAVEALPIRLAVMEFAVKFPKASRATIAEAVLEEVAVVAEFDTLLAVEIVANLVSTIAADAETSASTSKDVVKFPEASL